MDKSQLIRDLITQNQQRDMIDDNAHDALERRIKLLASRIFGEESPYLEDLRKILHPDVTVSYLGASEERLKQQKLNRRMKESEKLNNLLNTMLEDLDLSQSYLQQSSNISEYSNRVFIVHGHDEEMKSTVARIFEKLGFEAIILHEQANSGMTIIEKFETFSDVGFAIVLLSPDDMAYKRTESSDSAKPRARQNVILELGFFMGKLGRNRTFALVRDSNIEIPSDYSGVVYVPYDGIEGAWRTKLIQELRNLGYSVDANKLFA